MQSIANSSSTPSACLHCNCNLPHHDQVGFRDRNPSLGSTAITAATNNNNHAQLIQFLQVQTFSHFSLSGTPISNLLFASPGVQPNPDQLTISQFPGIPSSSPSRPPSSLSIAVPVPFNNAPSQIQTPVVPVSVASPPSRSSTFNPTLSIPGPREPSSSPISAVEISSDTQPIPQIALPTQPPTAQFYVELSSTPPPVELPSAPPPELHELLSDLSTLPSSTTRSHMENSHQNAVSQRLRRTIATDHLEPSSASRTSITNHTDRLSSHMCTCTHTASPRWWRIGFTAIFRRKAHQHNQNTDASARECNSNRLDGSLAVNRKEKSRKSAKRQFLCF